MPRRHQIATTTRSALTIYPQLIVQWRHGRRTITRRDGRNLLESRAFDVVFDEDVAGCGEHTFDAAGDCGDELGMRGAWVCNEYCLSFFGGCMRVANRMCDACGM